MLWVKLSTHIGDHERFLAAGSLARDLYFWGLTYSGKHELDGEVPMVAVLACPWGAGGPANIKVATKLVDVGLWARTDAGFLILRWTEQGNQTKAQLHADREASRERIRLKRSGNVRANTGRTFPDVPTSTSKSLSDSGSGSQIASPPAEGPPPWFVTAIEVITMGTGVALPVAESWLRYEGHRVGKGIAPTAKDAQYWLTTVMVPEAREVARRNARDGERTQAFVQQRSGPEVKPQDSRKELRERARWEQEAGPPDPDTAARMRALLGKVGT